MNTRLMQRIVRGCFLLIFIVGTASLPGKDAGAQVAGIDVLYTDDADFDQGTLMSVNHEAPYNDQLQLDSQIKPFPFINVAASGRGTVVRTNTETGEIVGEYRTAPEGGGLNPSRTTVDLFGNVWTANRDEAGEIDGILHGSTVKIGLSVGGTRLDENGVPDPEGGYLAPPFAYNTCVDRNGDGLIHTSTGLGDVLDWPDITDGLGGADGLVADAVDECILIYQRLPDAENPRHVSVDADNNVWVGGYPFQLRMFYKLDGTTGAILDSFDARPIGCGGYGGLVDGNGILWSVGGALLRYDPVAHTGFCIDQYGYGLGIDTDGYIWMSLWDGGIVKIAPDGTVMPGFPKPTFPPSMLTSLATGELSTLAAAEDTTASSMLSPDPAAPATISLHSKDLKQNHRITHSALDDMQALSDAPDGDPGITFQVSPVDQWVQSSSAWTPGATITLTIAEGGSVAYTDTQVADPGGYFSFNLWGRFYLQRGHVVTVSDGTTTKTHTVMNLFVDGVDMDTETLFGRADSGTSVDLWVHGNGGTSVTADAAGHWSADFSAPTDLTWFSDGGSQQFDSDGDSTGVWWASPRFQVSPDDDWVQSAGTWVPGATITLTVEDGGNVVYSNTQTADIHGHFNFDFGGAFDLQRGQLVTVSDGTTTKTHTVLGLYVDAVDVMADTIVGRAEPGASVDVWVHGNGNLNVTPEASGHWVADFSGQSGLGWFSDGGSQQADTDADATGVWWSAPRIEVSPQENWVQSWSRWTPGTTVTLTIEDGGAVVYSDTQTTDAHGNFHFGLWDIFDVQRGQTITVTDGTLAKTHTVMPLYVDHVDQAANTVSGRADASRDVEVWVNNDGWMAITPEASGSWSADFTGMTDLTDLTDGGSRQVDEDGDTTHVSWSSPRFWVAPDDNWVQSWSSWTPGATITLTVEGGGAPVYSDSQTANADGYFNFNLWESGRQLRRGQVVTVSDGTTTKTHTVMPLYVDSVNVSTDTLSGRADAGAGVEIWVHGNGNLYVTPDGSGNWVADFSGQTDLSYLSDGGSRQWDSDGDGTGVWWASPRIQVAPDDEWVQSVRPWTPGATITLTVEDGGEVAYTDSQVTDEIGNFRFDLWDIFDLQRGQTVTVSDGTTTKTHTVMPLYVDGLDVAAETLFGRAGPGTDVEAWVHGNGNVYVTADGSGHWVADFSGKTDLTYLNDGGSQQFDEDGDYTGVWWSTPSFQVHDADNSVYSWNRWAPGTTVTLTVEDGGIVVYSDSQTTDSHGNFGFGVGIDLDTGQQVTVTDGTIAKTHQVNSVNVTNIDTAADRVQGTANPGARVNVQVYFFNDWAERYVLAGLDGNWTADFSVPADGQPAYNITDLTFMTANEFDEDGDSTARRFGPRQMQNRGVAVTPIDNNIWVANSAYGTVTRLDNDGNVLKAIETGFEPTGVAVDAAGNVWATNMGSNNTVRIDPAAGPDGLGAVDMTVDLGPDAWPYNYSDMTGTVVVGSTSPQGFWTVIQDSGTPGFEWGRIVWNTEPQGDEPPGTAIVVEARAADTEAGLGGQTFQAIANGDLFSMFGRYIEVRVTLKASPQGASPVLSDIRIQPHVLYAQIDIKPGSFPNTINCKNKKEVITVALLTTADFDALTVDHTTVTFEGAGEIHFDRDGLLVRHVEDVGRDGDMDLVLHFNLKDTALTCASTTGKLVGLTYEGIPVEGTDSIRMVTR